MKPMYPFLISILITGSIILTASYGMAQNLHFIKNEHKAYSWEFIQSDDQYFKYEIADRPGCVNKDMSSSRQKKVAYSPLRIQAPIKDFSIPLYMSKSPETVQYSFLEENFKPIFHNSIRTRNTDYSH